MCYWFQVSYYWNRGGPWGGESWTTGSESKRLKEERREEEDGRRDNGAQWLNHGVFVEGHYHIPFGQAVMPISQSTPSLSNEYGANSTRKRHENSLGRGRKCVLYYLLLIKSQGIYTVCVAQLNRSSNTCNSTVRFVSVTCVFLFLVR